MARKIGSLFWEIGAKTDAFEQGLKGSKDRLGQLKSGVGDVVQGLTGFNISSLAGAGAIIALGNAVKSAVTNYQAYAEQIRSLAAITGTGTEETSRLVQAFDDLGVEAEASSTILATAARKGFVATIENVATLADEFNALTNQEEKNALLNERLGRGGLELAKVMAQGGEAIRSAAAAQSEGMVVTEENARAAEELRVAQDNLNDSWIALSNTVAKKTVPVMITWTDSLNTILALTQKANEQSKVMSQVDILAAGAKQLEAESNAQVAEAMTQSYTAMARLYSLQTMATPAVQAETQATDGLVASLRNLPGALQTVTADSEAARAKAADVAAAMQGMVSATESLQQAQQNWNKGAAQDVKAELEAQGIKGEALYKALGEIDLIMGSNFQTQENYKNNIAEIVKKFKEGGDTSVFREGLEKLKDKFRDLDDQVAIAKKTLAEMRVELQTLTSHPWVITVVTNFSGNGAPAAPSGSNPTAGAGGGYTDPGTGSGYGAGAESVGRAGGGGKAGGFSVNSININVNGSGNPSAAARAIANKLASYGKQYQGM